MTGGRAFYAVARDGKAPRQMAFINRLGSPYGAILAQGGWSVVLLCLPGSNFNTLLDYCVPVSWAFYALTSFCVVMLRRKEPNAYRPFKVPLYPLPIVIVLILAIAISTSSIIQSPFYCLLAFGFVAISFPVHMYWFEGQDICCRPKSIATETKRENPII
jgi:APA family basic amino acid/polyamine antiporter